MLTIDHPVFDLPNHMRITVNFMWRKRDQSDACLAVWYEEQLYDGAVGAREITHTPLGQFLLKHAYEL